MTMDRRSFIQSVAIALGLGRFLPTPSVSKELSFLDTGKVASAAFPLNGSYSVSITAIRPIGKAINSRGYRFSDYVKENPDPNAVWDDDV